MKTYHLLIIIMLIAAVIILIIFMKKNEYRDIENKWNKLISSETVEQEYKNTNDLKHWIFNKKKGYIEVLVVDKDGKVVNINNYNEEMLKIESVNINFYWKDKKFIGKSWNPISKDNIQIFFLE